MWPRLRGSVRGCGSAGVAGAFPSCSTAAARPAHRGASFLPARVPPSPAGCRGVEALPHSLSEHLTTSGKASRSCSSTERASSRGKLMRRKGNSWRTEKARRAAADCSSARPCRGAGGAAAGPSPSAPEEPLPSLTLFLTAVPVPMGPEFLLLFSSRRGLTRSGRSSVCPYLLGQLRRLIFLPLLWF